MDIKSSSEESKNEITQDSSSATGPANERRATVTFDVRLFCSM